MFKWFWSIFSSGTPVDKSNSLSMSVKLACNVFKIIILLMREVAHVFWKLLAVLSN